MTTPGSGPDAVRIAFRRDLRAEVVTGDAVYLHGEGSLTALRGDLLEQVADGLSNGETLAQLGARAGVLTGGATGTDPDLVGALLGELDDAGLLRVVDEAVCPDAGPAELAFWDAAGVGGEVAAARCRSARVALVDVVGGGPPDEAADLREQALRAAGLDVVRVDAPADLAAGGDPSAGSGADVTVVLCDDYLDPRLPDVVTHVERTGTPWLLARPVGSTVWIGPFFDPADPHLACWTCLADQLAVRRSATLQLRTLGGDVTAPTPGLAPLSALAAHAVALELAKWTAGLRYAGQRAIWTLAGLDLTGRRHPVRRRPQCPACGDPGVVAAAATRPVELRSRATPVDTGTGRRALGPEATLDRYAHLVGPVTGVVPDLQLDERAPALFHAVRAGGNHALRRAGGAAGMGGVRSALRSENGGKGTTLAQARASALCEGLERHSGTFDGTEAVTAASYRELAATHDVVHPDRCQLWSPRQLAQRAAWNSAHGPFQQVAPAFDDDAVMGWTPVWSLTGDGARFLPTGLLYFGVPSPIGHPSVRADSNGAAAGTTLEDAVLHGLCELVERDAAAVWWYGRVRVPGVALDDHDPYLGAVRGAHADLGREVWALDLTSDLGVPVRVALSRRVDGGAEEIVMGFGADPDPAVALRRAVSELNQLMPSLVARQRDGAPSPGAAADPDAEAWWRAGAVADQPWLRPDPTVAPAPTLDPAVVADPAAAVTAVRHRVEAAGSEVLVLDQTRPDVGLPVVKVVAPGLRGFWARFAPGRLFEVPVRLGRRTTPAAEDELNPFPLFL